MQYKEQPPSDPDVASRETLPPGPASPRRRGGSIDDDLFSGDNISRFSVSFTAKTGDGCNDFGAPREKQMWEATDGAVYMMRELAALDVQSTLELVPWVAEAARSGGFQGTFKLHETIWRCLPPLARSLGKQEFKRHVLELFLEPLFADLRCGHQLTEVEAARCLASIRDFIGPRILEGRLTDDQVHAVRALQMPVTAFPASTVLPRSNPRNEIGSVGLLNRAGSM